MYWILRNVYHCGSLRMSLWKALGMLMDNMIILLYASIGMLTWRYLMLTTGLYDMVKYTPYLFFYPLEQEQ